MGNIGDKWTGKSSFTNRAKRGNLLSPLKHLTSQRVWITECLMCCSLNTIGDAIVVYVLPQSGCHLFANLIIVYLIKSMFNHYLFIKYLI